MSEYPSASDIFEMKFPSRLRPFKRRRELGRVAATIIEGAPRDERFQEEANKPIQSPEQLMGLSYHRDAAEIRLELKNEINGAIVVAQAAIQKADEALYYQATGCPDRSVQPTLSGLELPEQGEQ